MTTGIKHMTVQALVSVLEKGLYSLHALPALDWPLFICTCKSCHSYLLLLLSYIRQSPLPVPFLNFKILP